MDPVTLTSAILTIATKCVTITKDVNDVRSQFNFASLTIIAICTESSICSSALFKLQTLLAKRQEQHTGISTSLQQLLDQPLFLTSCDAALTGCTLILSCLDDELHDLRQAVEQGTELNWSQKARTVWKEKTMKELLESLRGQVTALNLLLQSSQMESTVQTNELLVSQVGAIDRVKSDINALRVAYPRKSVTGSVLSSTRSIQEIFDEASSTVGIEEFEFDDEIVNAKAYRRVLAAAKRKQFEAHKPPIKLNSKEIPAASMGSEQHTLVQRHISGSGNKTSTTNPSTEDSLDLIQSGLRETSFSPSRVNDTSKAYEHTIPEPPRSVNLKRRETTLDISVAGIDRDLAKYHDMAKDGGFVKTKTLYRFGDYILGQTLGEGRAKVKKAWNKDTRQAHAVKIYKTNVHGNSGAIAFKEAQVLRNCNYHPNIVQYGGIIEKHCYIGIILEYMSGGQLEEYINANTYLKDGLARRLFSQIIGGVGFLHKKGVVHLNISAATLLLNQNHDIRIAGFGTAMSFNTESGSGWPLSPPHSELSVSVPYTAPELITYECRFPKLADLWSAGAVLYKMLAGSPPFDDVHEANAGDNGNNIGLQYEYIIAKTLKFPDNFTPPSRDLLRRLLVSQPESRAGMAEVARHSWLAEYAHVVAFLADHSM